VDAVRYVYDGLSYAVIQEWQDDGQGGQTLLREFIHAEDHITPVAMISYVPGRTGTYYYLRDERSNIAGLVDESGTLVESYVYDPYGVVYVWNGDIDGEPDRLSTDDPYDPADEWEFPLTPSFLGNPYGFTGHRFSAAGLYETPFR